MPTSATPTMARLSAQRSCCQRPSFASPMRTKARKRRALGPGVARNSSLDSSPKRFRLGSNTQPTRPRRPADTSSRGGRRALRRPRFRRRDDGAHRPRGGGRPPRPSSTTSDPSTPSSKRSRRRCSSIYRGMFDEALADDTTPSPSFSAGCARTWARGSRTSVRSFAACSARSCAFNSASTKAAWPNAPTSRRRHGVRADAARPAPW